MSFLISDFANRVTETTSGEVGQPLSMQITEVKSILHKTHYNIQKKHLHYLEAR